MNNQRGIGLTEAVVYAGMIGLVSLAGYSILNSSQSFYQKTANYQNFTELQAMVIERVKDKRFWEASLANPSNEATFKCLKEHTSCYGKGGTFDLYDSGNEPVNLVASSKNPNGGLGSKGEICSEFNSVEGSDKCPYRLVLKWTPRCIDSDCTDPTVEISGNFEKKFKSAANAGINTTAYNFSIEIKEAMNDAKGACESVGGNYEQAQNTCIMPFASSVCGADQFIVGFSDGKPICKNISGFSCPAGQVLLGIDNSGAAVCGPGCSSGGTTTGSVM